MIRINLLPVRQQKRLAAIQRQTTLFILVVGVLIGIFALAYVSTYAVVAGKRAEKNTLQTKADQLKKTVELIDKLKAQKDELDKKLDAIAQLEALRMGPVKILDEISARIPEDDAWLTSLAHTKDKLTLSGMAKDNETISLFMSNLGESPLFKDIELVRSAQEILNDIRLKSFSITCVVVLEPKKEEPDKEKSEPLKDQQAQAKTS